ncbi:MAG: hypothetical protein AB7S77_09670 [Desulfatirhabdiaceae bacterium]
MMIKDSSDFRFIDKISQYYGYFEENSLKGIAKKCTRLLINENFGLICGNEFIEPNYDEMEFLVLDILRKNFEEKVGNAIEQALPHLTEADIDSELDRLEKLYRREYQEQIRTTTNAALKELKTRIKNLQKEVKALKRKYTI